MRIYCGHDGYVYQGVPCRKNLRKLEADMWYTLWVSEDGGVTYKAAGESDAYTDFANQCRGYDGSGIRWFIRDGTGQRLEGERYLCAVHKAALQDNGLLRGSRLRAYIPAFYEQEGD